MNAQANASTRDDRLAALVSRGRFDDAEAICRERLAADDADHAAWYWHGIVLLERDRPGEALPKFEAAERLDDSVPEYPAHLGRCLARLRRLPEAAAAATRATALSPSDPQTLDTLGVIFSVAGDHARAATVLARAVEAAPNVANYRYNLGASLKFNGDEAGAEAAYEAALELDPGFDKARAALSHLRRQTAERNHVEALERRLRGYAGSLPDEMRLQFALAKELDDLGRYAEAFATLNDVSRRWRAQIRYSINDDARLFRALLEGFDASAVAAAGPGHPSEEPVFIVGMPRSGTTLTERILSSHSKVYAAGELNRFGLLVRKAADVRTHPEFTPDRVRKALATDLGALGRAYIESTRPATGHTPHFIDKMPLNFLFCGFILLALPRARIVCVRRNPLDTCLGNFRQLFSLRSAYYAYSYDLLDCGRYFLMFDTLMRHWDALFPGRILTVRYEDIVDDQEAQSRRLVEHCGLEWEEACLAFEQNPAPVATASSAQVRRPVYRSALAHWKNYAEELAPLAALLREGGVDLGD